MKPYCVFSLLLLCCIRPALAQDHDILARDSFSLNYPAKWKVNTKEKEYNPDSSFSIQAPGKLNNITFLIRYQKSRTDMSLDNLLAAIIPKPIKDPNITTFTEWGNLKGDGREVTGRIRGTTIMIRFFFYNTDRRSMLVAETYSNGPEEKLRKEFEIISSSFTFN